MKTKLPKGFPKWQTAAWWIKELEQCNPKAIVMIATCMGSAPAAFLSIYPADDVCDDLMKAKQIWIDVGLE